MVSEGGTFRVHLEAILPTTWFKQKCKFNTHTHYTKLTTNSISDYKCKPLDIIGKERDSECEKRQWIEFSLNTAATTWCMFIILNTYTLHITIEYTEHYMYTYTPHRLFYHTTLNPPVCSVFYVTLPVLNLDRIL